MELSRIMLVSLKFCRGYQRLSSIRKLDIPNQIKIFVIYIATFCDPDVTVFISRQGIWNSRISSDQDFSFVSVIVGLPETPESPEFLDHAPLTTVTIKLTTFWTESP